MTQFRRSFLIGSAFVSLWAAFQPIQAASLFEASAISLRRASVSLRPTLFSTSRRLHSSSDEFRTGRYAQVTEDVAFKHIMHKENLRNSFLSAILGETINHSEILDTSLNPIKEFENLRKVINKRGFNERNISRGKTSKGYKYSNEQTPAKPGEVFGRTCFALSAALTCCSSI